MALERDRLLKPVKKLRNLIRQIDSGPAPDTVHKLRTNTRRFEATLEALSLDERVIGKSMLKDLRRLRKRAGKVRDMDVLTAFASTVHPRGEEECGVQLLERLGARRKTQAEKLYAETKEVRSSLGKSLKRSRSILIKMMRKNKETQDGNKVAAEAAATAVKLATRLGTPQCLGKTNLHPYRLRIKELRNVLRMASGSARPRFVEDLGKVKDAIGEWHDWEELVSIAEKVLDHKTGCGLKAELKHIAGQKYERSLGLAQQLRKRYLRKISPFRKGASSASLKIPRTPVWEATSLLAS